MVNKIRYATLILVVGLLIAGCKTASSGKEKPDYKAENDKNGISSYSRFWEFPPPPKPHDFGNLLLDRRSAGSDVGPVIFSHWTHRIKYSCRICHFELEFSFKRNATEFTEQDNRNGLFCGACHNGKEAFGHTEENCAKCHDQDPSYYEKNFGSVLGRLPRAKEGKPQVQHLRGQEFQKFQEGRRPRVRVGASRAAGLFSARGARKAARLLELPPGDLQHREKDYETLQDGLYPAGAVLRRMPSERRLSDERLREMSSEDRELRQGDIIR
jgi:c(7)-type cytochrome triheme protein